MSAPLTTDIFIQRARAIHGDKYDYSKVEYVNAKTKVCITCPKHGDFWQAPTGHLIGKGCNLCGNENIHNTQASSSSAFIEKARLVHGDKYDYSQVQYFNCSTKVSIICPKHGEFFQTPNGHLNGKGCPSCGSESKASARRMSNADFIKRAREVHGDKYDYSKVNISNSHTAVVIVCPDHGDFLQTPSTHLRGAGCPKCAGRGKTLLDFLRVAQSVHGDRYNYSKVNYIDTEKKVCIICNEHGEFWQSPYAHLHGHGCPKCAGKGLSIKELVQKARLIHGDKYDYSHMNYVDAMTDVCIICPTHGKFWQRFGHHVHGSGCPQCGELIRLKKGEDRRLGEQEFICRATELHANKYDYSLLNYVNARRKVNIICPVHGVFSQTPDKHLQGAGCPRCVGFGRTTSDFIAEAIAVHGELYCYDQTVYKNIKSHVCIECPKHGAFWQIAERHLNGAGCPRCASSKLQSAVRSFLHEKQYVYVEEQKFDWMTDKGNLRLDFYLPDFKVAIECQGIQHFDAIDFFGGEDALEENKRRDLLKRELCEKNGIKILYYSNLGVPYPYQVYESLSELDMAISHTI